MSSRPPSHAGQISAVGARFQARIFWSALFPRWRFFRGAEGRSYDEPLADALVGFEEHDLAASFLSHRRGWWYESPTVGKKSGVIPVRVQRDVGVLLFFALPRNTNWLFYQGRRSAPSSSPTNGFVPSTVEPSGGRWLPPCGTARFTLEWMLDLPRPSGTRYIAGGTFCKAVRTVSGSILSFIVLARLEPARKAPA